MSKVASVLSGLAVILLLIVLGSTLIHLSASEAQVNQVTASGVGTAFTYQGHLADSGGPANGPFDLTFSLYDDPGGGSQVGSPISRTITVTDGLLTLDLDFGSVFDGTALWLEIHVRPAGDAGPYTTLLPRQRLAPTPLAVYASGAPWTGLSGVPSGFGDGIDDDTLTSLDCASGQIPKWNGDTWSCGEDNVGTGSGAGDITAVIAGYGLGGGSTSGDANLFVVTETVQARVDGTCPTGWSIQAIHQNGSVICERDTDTTYQAGAGLSLVGTTFALPSTYRLPQTCGDGQLAKWDSLTEAWLCDDDLDTDTDTTYSAGNQITLTGTIFDVVEGAGSGLDADLLDGQQGAYYLAWENLTGAPAGLDDGDDDTLGALSCAAAQVAKWDGDLGHWTCAPDDDTGTIYQPGVGLTLSGTMFAISSTYQLPQTCAISQTVKWNGNGWACGKDELGAGGSAWLLAGNAGISTTTDFLGTTDNQALELRVNGSRALRLEPSDNSPNILGGYDGNRVEVDVYGAAIGGGGQDSAINQVTANYGTIGGGAGNTSEGYAATIGGGEGNRAGDSNATVGGGSANTAGGSYATIGGGRSNAGTGTLTTIAGGGFNRAGAGYATVGGGGSNVVSDTFGTISGGQDNQVTGTHASIGGGSYNRVAAAYGTIAGGGPADLGNPTTSNNQVYDQYGTVGGGGGNVAGGEDGAPAAQPYATVGGGASNTAGDGYATVGGGALNLAGGYAATVGGGESNSVSHQYATIGGGRGNTAGNQYATVGGGRNNSGDHQYATVGGGYGNTVTGTFGTIPGGALNTVEAPYGFAAGRQASAAHQGAFVWSDSTGPTASTGPDQFLISAAGGVGIGTNAPSHKLTVAGDAAIRSSTVISVGTIVASLKMLQAPRALHAVGDLLYVTGYATNTLSIWNVSDPPNHTPIGYTTFQLHGPVDLQVVGDRAYLASQNSNMLTILDVSDPADPSHVGDTTEYLDYPQGVHVSGKYAYVASMGSGGRYDGLTIFDVTNAPAEIAATSFITTYLQGTSDVFVVDNFAYVTSRDNHRLVVFDVSDPRKPLPVSYTEVSLSQPVRVYVSGIYAYVVAEGANSVVVFDVSNPAQIAYLGQITTALTRPRSIYVSGERAYVAYAGDEVTAAHCGLVVLDISNPAETAVLNVIDMSTWLNVDLVPPKPVAVTGSGDRIYVANEQHDTVTIFEIDGLEASAVRAGELQVAHLEVSDDAAIEGGLSIRGGLNVGSGGALVQGTLSVEGPDDSYIQGRLGIGPPATVITRSVSPTESEEVILRHPTHQLDVDGEARFRVSDRNHLVLRSPNTATSDDSAYIDFVELTYTDALTPSARIAFLTVDPLIPARTGLYFYTRGADDAKAVSRLEIEPEGDVRPGADSQYSLGTETRRWLKVWAYNYATTSDVRKKENVKPLPYGQAEVNALRPVVFSWIHDAEQRPHYGLIAQEVREVLPDIVSGDEGEGSLSMDYGELVPVLVKAIQEQQDEIETQSDQIAALEARLAALEGTRTDQDGRSGVRDTLSRLGIGGLVLGAVFLVGARRHDVWSRLTRDL